jgi:uncharacterized protein YkwD
VKALVLSVVMSAFVSSPAVFTSPTAEYTNHLNYSRWAAGLWGVCTDGPLAKSAQAQAEKMAANGYLSHTPNLLAAAPAGASVVAENVGVSRDMASLHVAFLNSRAHSANIYNRSFTHIGVGSVNTGGEVWVSIILMSYPGRGCGLW